jgi:hypothetical protein
MTLLDLQVRLLKQEICRFDGEHRKRRLTWKNDKPSKSMLSVAGESVQPLINPVTNSIACNVLRSSSIIYRSTLPEKARDAVENISGSPKRIWNQGELCVADVEMLSQSNPC